MDFKVRDMKLSEFDDIFDKIKHDFAQGEYAPYEVLHSQIQNGVQRGFIFVHGDQDVAYSICAEGQKYPYVLISLFAVYKEFRQSGYGSIFLEEIKKLYSDKAAIIAEVEKPEEAKNKKEKNIRTKRMEFYQKAGFYPVPEIDYSIWHVPMHLMLLSPKAKQISNKELGEAIYDIYFKLMGERYIGMMKFRMLDEKEIFK
jgi:GNAT superfamily N-acetyltransferase